MAIRVAGVRSGQLATAGSFVNISLLVSRLSNMFQAPLLGVMVDQASRHPDVLGPALAQSFRGVIASGFVGTALAALLVPNLAILVAKGMEHFKQDASIIKVMSKALWPGRWPRLTRTLLKRPSFHGKQAVTWEGIPRVFLAVNVLVTAIYTIGVLSALLAGALNPELKATAIQLSGIVNGIATICLVLFVDPGSAHVIDAVVAGRRHEGHMWAVVISLTLGRLLGVGILAQILFLPATGYINWAAHWLTGLL